MWSAKAYLDGRQRWPQSLHRFFSVGRNEGSPNNNQVRNVFRLSKKSTVFLLPHSGQVSASDSQVAESSVSNASICCASYACDSGTCTFTPPSAFEYSQFIPTVCSSATKPGIPADSSCYLTKLASYGVLYLPIVTRLSVMFFLAQRFEDYGARSGPVHPFVRSFASAMSFLRLDLNLDRFYFIVDHA